MPSARVGGHFEQRLGPVRSLSARSSPTAAPVKRRHRCSPPTPGWPAVCRSAAAHPNAPRATSRPSAARRMSAARPGRHRPVLGRPGRCRPGPTAGPHRRPGRRPERAAVEVIRRARSAAAQASTAASSKETHHASDGFCGVDIHRVLVHSEPPRSPSSQKRRPAARPARTCGKPCTSAIPKVGSPSWRSGKTCSLVAVAAIEDARTEALSLVRPTRRPRVLVNPRVARIVWVAQHRTELRTALPRPGCVAGLAPIAFRDPANSRRRVRAVAP